MPVPELRIIDETLWQAAHARIAEHRTLYRSATKGLRGGRPHVYIESKYLLPGLAVCTCCAGSLTVRTRNNGSAGARRRAFFYACNTRISHGVGPMGGFVACALGGWWVSRGTFADAERNGLTLGVTVAGFDLALLAMSGAPFGALMVLSATGRIAGGYAGGWWAGRRNRPAALRAS